MPLPTEEKASFPQELLPFAENFGQVDLVTCTDETGKAFARGLVNFSANDLRKIMGKQTRKIREILGSQEYEEVIHRDNLVLL